MEQQPIDLDPPALEPRIASGFAALLGSHDQSKLDESASSICGILRDGQLAYLNRGWFSFAVENDGAEMLKNWVLGTNWWDVIGAPLRPYFENGFEKCLASGNPWSHVYECSSPTQYRRFHMVTYPLAEQRGLLMIHSLRYEAPHHDAGAAWDPSGYVDESGMLTQCMHCRRLRRADNAGWDWVGDSLRADPETLSGGLCPPCSAHYYPGAQAP